LYNLWIPFGFCKKYFVLDENVCVFPRIRSGPAVKLVDFGFQNLFFVVRVFKISICGWFFVFRGELGYFCWVIFIITIFWLLLVF